MSRPNYEARLYCFKYQSAKPLFSHWYYYGHVQCPKLTLHPTPAVLNFLSGFTHIWSFTHSMQAHIFYEITLKRYQNIRMIGWVHIKCA